MNISNFVEPIVFEMSEDVHSVVVLLGPEDVTPKTLLDTRLLCVRSWIECFLPRSLLLQLRVGDRWHVSGRASALRYTRLDEGR